MNGWYPYVFSGRSIFVKDGPPDNYPKSSRPYSKHNHRLHVSDYRIHRNSGLLHWCLPDVPGNGTEKYRKRNGHFPFHRKHWFFQVLRSRFCVLPTLPFSDQSLWSLFVSSFSLAPHWYTKLHNGHSTKAERHSSRPPRRYYPLLPCVFLPPIYQIGEYPSSSAPYPSPYRYIPAGYSTYSDNRKSRYR